MILFSQAATKGYDGYIHLSTYPMMAVRKTCFSQYNHAHETQTRTFVLHMKWWEILTLIR